MQIYNGALGAGSLPALEIYKDSENFNYIMDAILTGNTVEAQQLVLFSKMADRFFEETPHEKGQRLPLKTFNIKFSEGNFMSTASVFHMNVTSKEMRKTSFNALTYRLDEEDFYEVEAKAKMDLLNYILTATDGVMKAYTNYFLPGQKYIAILSGSSMSDTIPPINLGGEYMSSFGALRGENVSEFLLKPSLTEADNSRNHFLAIKTAEIEADDIKRAKRLIKSYKTYSKVGVSCLINPDELDDLRSILALDTITEDKMVLGDDQFEGHEAVRILGVDFIPFELVDKGLQIYFDMGRTGADMGLKLVRKSEKQRGIKLIVSKRTEIFKTEDLYEFFQEQGQNGSKLFIAPVSWLIHARESMVFLDTENDETSGEMGTAGVDAITGFITNTRGMFMEV